VNFSYVTKQFAPTRRGILREALSRIIHHTRGASLCIRHHSTFASFTNTTSIRSVTKSTVMSNPYAIHSLSGELSRLYQPGVFSMIRRLIRFAAFYLTALFIAVGCGDDDGTEADRAGIGAECSDSDDCYGEELSCLLEFKAGYCGLTGCTSNDDCPTGSACVSHNDGTNYCFRSCISKVECNRNRSLDNAANCSSDVEFVQESKDQKAYVPPSSGDEKK